MCLWKDNCGFYSILENNKQVPILKHYRDGMVFQVMLIYAKKDLTITLGIVITTLSKVISTFTFCPFEQINTYSLLQMVK